MKKKSISRRNAWLLIGLVLIVLILVIAKSWSAVGARLANPMRQILGIKRVAQMETFLFNIQDGIARLKVSVGLDKEENPWETTAGQSAPLAPPSTHTPIPSATPVPVEATEALAGAALADDTPTPGVTSTPTPAPWSLANLQPFSQVDGEGVWQPYLTNSKGEIVSYRTFLKPDPERPYALVAVVAVDLAKTRLHFVLGVDEPAKPGGIHGNGLIPEADKQPGKLLAAFNGGFIYEHGQYGAMANGVTPLGGREGLATLAIAPNGDVRIGEWKIDLSSEEKWEAWRQNALMILHDGAVNPKVETGSYLEWGANLDGATVTVRSSVGLSADNQVLYYFAGPSLSMPTLASAMAVAGVADGMLLDINPTHAHFTAIRQQGEQLSAEPLLEEEMKMWVDRYLSQWGQDFFYLTEKE